VYDSCDLRFVCCPEFVKCIIVCAWPGFACYVSEQWAETDNLAQASWPHLGEMSRGSPRSFRARGRSGDQLILSERVSRSGEEGLA